MRYVDIGDASNEPHVFFGCRFNLHSHYRIPIGFVYWLYVMCISRRALLIPAIKCSLGEYKRALGIAGMRFGNHDPLHPPWRMINEKFMEMDKILLEDVRPPLSNSGSGCKLPHLS